MAIYVLLSKLTPEGAQTLHSDPSRVGEVNTEIRESGCKVLQQFATLGEYDFVSIVEAPDNKAIAHLSIDLAARGTLAITTLPAISIGELMEGLQDGRDLA